MPLVQNRPNKPKFLNLHIEFFPRNTSFMVNECIGQKGSFITCLQNALGEIRVFSRMYFCKTTCFFEHFLGKAHIKTSGLKILYTVFTTSYSSCCKKRSHHIIYGFLQRGETAVSRICTSKTMKKTFTQK